MKNLKNRGVKDFAVGQSFTVVLGKDHFSHPDEALAAR